MVVKGPGVEPSLDRYETDNKYSASNFIRYLETLGAAKILVSHGRDVQGILKKLSPLGNVGKEGTKKKQRIKADMSTLQ